MSAFSILIYSHWDAASDLLAEMGIRNKYLIIIIFNQRRENKSWIWAIKIHMIKYRRLLHYS